jgi:pyruvate ferredoxin oxidoreductase beta subunit
MALSVKDLKSRPERLAPGHRACAGCTAPIVLKTAMKMTDANLVCSIATGCMEVSTGIYPFNSWNVSLIHSAFENAAATISGVEAAYQKLHRDGKVKENFKFIGFAGDGGTYDIGFQSLSGAMERGHDMLFICYDNQAYMNTGIQRSSATPRGAATNTAQAGSVKQGKEQNRKDLTQIMIHHGIPYAAQASVHNIRDLMRKVERGLEVKGAAFINVLAPCHRGWRIKVEDGLESARLAVESRFWPLYEVDNGQWKINYTPKETIPVADWMLPQGRFAHLKKPDNKHILDEAQADVDKQWERLQKLCAL